MVAPKAAVVFGRFDIINILRIVVSLFQGITSNPCPKKFESPGVGQRMRLVLVYDWVIIFVLVLSARGRGSMHGILRGSVSMSDRSNYQTESVVLNTRLK